MDSALAYTATRLSQNLASRHSFKQIAFFAENSLSLYADFDSMQFAPTEPAASKSW